MGQQRHPVLNDAVDNEHSSLNVQRRIPQLLDCLKQQAFNPNLGRGTAKVDEYHNNYNALHEIHRFLLDSETSSHAKDVFGNSNGFDTVLGFFSRSPPVDALSSFDQYQQLLYLLKLVCEIILDALTEHAVNQEYFASQTSSSTNGWDAILQATVDSGLAFCDYTGAAHICQRQEQLFGLLLALALRDSSLTTLFRGSATVQIPLDDSMSVSFPDSDVLGHNSSLSVADKLAFRPPLDSVHNHLRKKLNGKEIIVFPRMLTIAFQFWLRLPRAPKLIISEHHNLSILVIRTFTELAGYGKTNLVAMHAAHLSHLVFSALDSTSFSRVEYTNLRALLIELLSLGMDSLYDVADLSRKAATSEAASTLLLDAIRRSGEPAHFHFDLTTRGHASIDFAELKHVFPPLGSGAGYTFMAWFMIDQFDDSISTTIFTLADENRDCYLSIYLDKTTRQLVVRTSNTHSNSIVIFESVVFEESKWHHLTLVHRRRSKESSVLALFVNGGFCEQLNVAYPCSPRSASVMSIASDRVSYLRKDIPVRVTLGASEDVTVRLGTGAVRLKWSLASAHLFRTPLSDDHIFVLEKLGPSYQGNFQDCVSSLLTYGASAELNIYNEKLDVRSRAMSTITTIVQSKPWKSNFEEQLMLSLTPRALIGCSDLLRGSFNQINKTFTRRYTAKWDSRFRNQLQVAVINAAMPSISLQPSGFGTTNGGLLVCRPYSVQDASWCLGGSSTLAIRIIQSASSMSSVLRGLDICFELIVNSWRNSEVLERDEGYGFLVNVLQDKIDQFASLQSDRANDHQSFAIHILQRILRFSGWDEQQPQESMIVNPLAYRIFITDFDHWLQADLDTQLFYLDQYIVFSQRSRNRDLNNKILGQTRIVNRLLSGLKCAVIHEQALPLVVEVFKGLLRVKASAEVLRAIALYVTYALHQDDDNISRRGHWQSRTAVQSSIYSSGSASKKEMKATWKSVPAPNEKVEQSIFSRSMLGFLHSWLCKKDDVTNIKRFTRAVTSKWLLHLLAENDESIVVYAIRILSRMLVVNGIAYTDKFETRSKGFESMKTDLASWWNIDQVWISGFACLLGIDVANFAHNIVFDGAVILKQMGLPNQVTLKSGLMPVLLALLDTGLTACGRCHIAETVGQLASQSNGQTANIDMTRSADLLCSILRFFTILIDKVPSFKTLALHSNLPKHLIPMLYSISGKALDQDQSVRQWTEVDSSVAAQDQISTGSKNVSISDNRRPATPPRVFRRVSSFVVVDRSSYIEPVLGFKCPLSPAINASDIANHKSTLYAEALKLALILFRVQVLDEIEFTGYGLFLKAPPASANDIVAISSEFITNSLSDLEMTLIKEPSLFLSMTRLTNITRYTTQVGEAILEGWFYNGALPLLKVIARILQVLQTQMDTLTLNNMLSRGGVLASLRSMYRRITILWLVSDSAKPTLFECAIFDIMPHWDLVWSDRSMNQDNVIHAIMYLLYVRAISNDEATQEDAPKLWSCMVTQLPSNLESIKNRTNVSTAIYQQFASHMQSYEASTHHWIDRHRVQLDQAFSIQSRKALHQIIQEENEMSAARANTRMAKREARMQDWAREIASLHLYREEHDKATKHWNANIQSSESLKQQNFQQDYAETVSSRRAAWVARTDQLSKSSLWTGLESHQNWQLDEAEGHDRLRMRLVPEHKMRDIIYQPKRRNTCTNPPSTHFVPSDLIRQTSTNSGVIDISADGGEDGEGNEQGLCTSGMADEEDFEVVEEPRENLHHYVDKNRRVMQSLQQGDQVVGVYNVSRIAGLESRECLLVVGRLCVYMMDDLFQRSDGEIVAVTDAPADERDVYTRSLSGRADVTLARRSENNTDLEKRRWLWDEIISISKRRFLFREVAIEIFFVDGRSYLLTLALTNMRNQLYRTMADLSSRQTRFGSSEMKEGAWRAEMLPKPRDDATSLGSKMATILGTSSTPATKQWAKGELSNFHYLMLINTMAGRTFNDLTQYPVLPWVLADYTSEELDLTNPKSFRDFSKPMGCQTGSRESAFKERFQSFAEMGGETPSFHYGTHYSSAMIVTSCLIRLQPFVHSYLLLQGGTFDHADRLFSSIEKAWLSASGETMTDVRELTPEFFYLPEMFTNVNGYDFGTSETSGEVVNDVVLPPWAKGDPSIFVAKHREALESAYVSEHLHQWIDLIFGYKQRGDAAIQATNVFHHLSYQGAKDLDSIDDEMERLATIGIIHNFGQTPEQVFQRPHDARHVAKAKTSRLLRSMEALTMVSAPLIEVTDRVVRLHLCGREKRLFPAGPLKIYPAPDFKYFLQWGFADDSVRFFSTETNKPMGVIEQLHTASVTEARFAGGKTLVTASEDCTVAVWTLKSSHDEIKMQLQGVLCGHSQPVIVLSVCSTLGTVLSASADGHVILWDLYRRELVRSFQAGRQVSNGLINATTGRILLCCGSRVQLYTLNGALLVDQLVGASETDSVAGASFFEPHGDEWLGRELIFTGHARGVVNIWSVEVHPQHGRWYLRHAHRLLHPRLTLGDDAAAITCILPLPSKVYTGDEDGRVMEWNFARA